MVNNKVARFMAHGVYVMCSFCLGLWVCSRVISVNQTSYDVIK